MTPEQWEWVRQLRNAAFEIEPAKRTAFLDAACQNDPEVRAEVERLFVEIPGSFLEKPFLPQPEVPSLADVTFTDGALISGRYKILRFVAKGGMGEVYEAEDLELETTVALKTLLSGDGRSEVLIARFKREIQLARQVTHPNVCRIYDLGRCQSPRGDDVPYLTMEFLKGETLAKRIARVGPFSMEEALPLVRQMTGALSAAHKLRIIHRDFKSSNVMLISDGYEDAVKVTDFGLARSMSDCQKQDGGLTVPGQIMGTPPYMAPEQYRGEASEATDIYALGVVMYEMVAGERRLNLDWTIEDAFQDSDHTSILQLEPRWQSAIQKCVRLNPADRLAEEAIAPSPFYSDYVHTPL